MRFFEAGLRRIEAGFNLLFSEAWNPWYQLGALCFFFFWIVIVSGVYLFVFFDTSILGAFDSVEAITYEQWYAGGVMRSLHRYASDAMVVVVTLHLLRELVLGRYRGVRWFSWFSGVPLLWLLFAAGIGGYWLVWDELALYIAVVTSEWIDWLPSFGDALARNFLSEQVLSDRFFSLLVFLHVAIPLFLLLGTLIHMKRVKLARSAPARGLMWGTTAALLILSLVRPVESMERADLTFTAAQVDLDWFFLNVYPLFDSLGYGAVWGMLGGLTLILAALPWLPPEKKTIELEPAVINPANCNGCGWCFQDCPYEAITMIPHTYKPRVHQAVVDPDLCTACGICEGSCPSATPFRHVEELVSGIEVPGYPLDELRRNSEAALEDMQGDGIVVLFGCDHALNVAELKGSRIATVSIPCIGMLPPSFADFMARKPEVLGVMISGCQPNDCFFRKGSEWTRQRFSGERMPHLRTKAAKEKVRIAWAGPHEGKTLLVELARFRDELEQPDQHQAADQVEEAV
jgi:quinol-cytochrome oxidoreductase complex cytochrome b subunit/coenzyme F420-reducing hydrogenase delta subunit/ferredoxin